MDDDFSGAGIIMTLPRLALFYGLGALFLALFALSHTVASAQDCQSSNVGMARMHSVRIALLNDIGERIEVVALIADDALERASGYQHICADVIANTAILFHYATPIVGRFHMRNVKAPLDIAFFDEHGVLIQVTVMRPYEDGEQILYGPMHKFQYALETRVGFFKEKGLSAGSSHLLFEALP